MLLRALRLFWKFLKWSVLLVIVLAALLVAINWRDEPLSDQARALLEAKPVQPVPDNQNIYVAMAGLDAPQGADIFETGYNRVKASYKRYEQLRLGLKYSEDQDEKELSWQETKPPFNSKIDRETNFPESARTQKNRLTTTLATNKTLVQRYLSMQDLPRYAVPADACLVGYPVRYARVLNIQRHLLAQTLLEMEAGNTVAGLTFFEKDLAMWRRVLEGKSCFVDAMIAVRAITNDVYVLNLLLASPSIPIDKQKPQWQALLTPLSQEQYSMFWAMKGEIRSGYATYNAVPVYKKLVSYHEIAAQEVHLCLWFDYEFDKDCPLWNMWLEQNAAVFFYKPTAAYNYAAPLYQTGLNLTRLSWRDYLVENDKAQKFLAEAYKPKINWIYNPMGKLQAGSNHINPDGYMKRMHDLDTYLRLVRLQLELRLAKVPAAKIPDFIRTYCQASDCPPDADFSWDAKTRLLSFKPSYERVFTQNIPASVYVPEMDIPNH